MPQLPKVSTARGMQAQPSSWHLASFAVCFLHSAAYAAAPAVELASLKVAGVRGDVTVMSRAAGDPLSQP